MNDVLFIHFFSFGYFIVDAKITIFYFLFKMCLNDGWFLYDYFDLRFCYYAFQSDRTKGSKVFLEMYLLRPVLEKY